MQTMLKIAARERQRLSRQGSLRGQQSLRQVSVSERTQSVCASLRVVTLGSVWEKTVGPCVTVCRCGYGTWMLQNRTGFILHQTGLLQEDGPMRSAV